MSKRIVASLFALALATSPALAGSSTIAVTPGSGATYQVITNGGGNFVGMFGLCDGVAAAQCVAVKPASTAALAADPSLVVTISPNTATLPVSGTFWQTTQPVSGTFWQTTQPISAASLPLPTGASTAAGLTTINTTLGSPFQAGGSIGNTTFAATQSGSWSLVNISGTVSLPTGAATSANQTNASQKTQIVDGSGNVIASTSNNLDVQCANCSGSGVSTADGASWTSGSSLFAGIGGAYQTIVTSNPLTAGDQGFAQLTHYRALMADWFNSSGTEMGTSGSPVQVSLANTGANSTAVAISATSLPLPTNAAAETGGNLATLAGAVTASVVQSNTKQVNGVTTLAGAGATGTGSQRVTAAQDTTTIAGSAPGTAGSASTNVVTVQGIGSMTPLLANPGTPANWAILADNAAWTVGTTPQTAIGCEYTSGGATALTTGHVGTPGCTSARAIFTDKSSVGGTALVASVSAYGTPPTGTEVEGVNAYVTNTNANGQTTMSASSPVVIASDQSAVAVKAASGAFASGSIASGAIASGAIASGAAVSGAFASGAVVDLTNIEGVIGVATAPTKMALSGEVYNSTAPAPTSGQSMSLQSDPNGYLRTAPQCNKVINIAQTATTDVHTFTEYGYICSVILVSATAQNIGIDEGTGTTCETSGTAMIGVSSTSAATAQMALAANGGFSSVASVSWLRTQTSADHLCVIQSSTGEVAGTITYADLAN